MPAKSLSHFSGRQELFHKIGSLQDSEQPGKSSPRFKLTRCGNESTEIGEEKG
jgi:hypothetical protein